MALEELGYPLSAIHYFAGFVLNASDAHQWRWIDHATRDAFDDWSGARGLAEDVRRYGAWMREQAHQRIGHLYPPIEVTAQMVAAGERTGRLAEVLDKVATVSEEDLDEQIKASTQMIEPIVITLMGAMIGGIAIALLLPIFTMGSMMGS